MYFNMFTGKGEFLSTPSARRATLSGGELALNTEISIHALREEGDHRPQRRLSGRRNISIHALREEGDFLFAPSLTAFSDFYPRPPRGGRQADSQALIQLSVISIHALREEGDSTSICIKQCFRNFYPRPPRGGRHRKQIVQYKDLDISIHALREEGDILKCPCKAVPIVIISIHALREEGDGLHRHAYRW